ncbi:hypothetical protein [Pseudoalteromonas sp. SWYJZ19]|uniref:hypothetical protein n=1 Tax=Pseudoalteromonas sp. SWYJZ19 TaxID=2792068 RepID=UPI0018CF1835|nr:hypothetical protein [Pseudoalteromonas sp. SWYJZ19]MBH0051119.1 hypothetical protein [Pseudoalteromonas sp. SWYJZ19]
MKKSIYLNEWLVCTLLILIGFIVGISTNSIMDILLSKFKQDSLTNWITSTSTFLIMIGTIGLTYLAWNAKDSWFTQKSLDTKLELLGSTVNYFINISESVHQTNERKKKINELKKLDPQLDLLSNLNSNRAKVRELEQEFNQLKEAISHFNKDLANIAIQIENSKQKLLVNVAKLPDNKLKSNELVLKMIGLKAEQAYSNFPEFYEEMNTHYLDLQDTLFPKQEKLALPSQTVES